MTQFHVNAKYKPVLVEKSRYFVLMGGRGAGRSTFASQYAVGRLLYKDYFRCAVMRYIFRDIRDSIFKEITDRIEEQGLEGVVEVNGSMLIARYGRNEIIAKSFKKSSGDQKAKLKSLANFNCVIIEEADEVDEESFNQLDDSIRTLNSDIKIILLLNPPSKNHWIIKRWFNLLPSESEEHYIAQLRSDIDNVTYVHATYEDNRKNMNESSLINYERYKENNPDHYYSMIKGLVGEGKKGRIFRNTKPISLEEFRQLPYASYYGLDYGFTNDPTALVEIKYHNNTIWVNQLIYQKGMTNQDISKRMTELEISKESLIVADSAEPKSIEEIKREGWNIKPSVKGADSIRSGVQLLLDHVIYYTSTSKNIEDEFLNHVWAMDKDKNPTNEPVDEYNHSIDAIRYILTNLKFKDEYTFSVLSV